MIGFETIGNATITFFDNSKPVLSSDPWIDGNPYFGSWGHKYNIPNEQKNNIINSKYIWYSHGHPDHLDEKSFNYFKNSIILIPDHYGDRIYNYLKPLIRFYFNAIKFFSQIIIYAITIVIWY